MNDNYYSKDVLAIVKAGSEAMRDEMARLEILPEEQVHKFMMAVLRMFTRALASGYMASSSNNPEEIVKLFMTAAQQRVNAEIFRMQQKDETTTH